MFEHPHHKKIHLILKSLDASLFYEVGAHFGDGTLITLLHNEYRWSKDVDFICPVGPGYKRLRELVSDNKFKPHFFFGKKDKLEFPRDLTANQYGVRFVVVAESQPIKFEIIAENRIELEKPDIFDWTELPCLSRVDRVAEKLLANADRWNDTAIRSRDLIDLAVMRESGKLPTEAINKADAAYPVISPLKEALNKFQNLEGYQDKCFNALQIEERDLVLKGINFLVDDFQ